MKLSELLEPGKPCRLTHPECGIVKWDVLVCEFTLMFARGPERGEPLYADAAVIFGEDWDLYPEPWAGKIGRVADQCLACGRKDKTFDHAEDQTLCPDCLPVNRKPKPHLVLRLQKRTDQAVQDWCEANGFDYEREREIFSN